MISIKNRVFHLATKGSSYVFAILEGGIAEHLYYGHRITDPELYFRSLEPRRLSGRVNEISFDEDNPNYQLQNEMGILSTEGKGDYRATEFAVTYSEKGLRTLDLRYTGHEVSKGIDRMDTSLPQALGSDEETEVLNIQFVDRVAGVRVNLLYTLFADSDVIARRAIVRNISKDRIILRAAYSLQLDLPESDYDLTTLDGAWARERVACTRPLTTGRIVNESRRGASSAEHNPGLILEKRGSNEAYAINLIYSGAHAESIEVDSYGRTRILTGINPDMFTARLERDFAFETPEAVMLYSVRGRSGIQDEMHAFVRNHIQRGLWKNRLRPVVFNTWDACGYSFNEQKIEQLVKEASSLGFEAFLLCDGWFGVRNNDSSSLGDWNVNTLKIPEGLAGLSKDIHRSGMLFGIFLEPEMVSINSFLYQKHPDWAIVDPKRKEHPIARNQYILDITRQDVFNYLLDTIRNLIQTASIDYIKWDMNRHLAEVFSRTSGIDDMGEYMHRYILALYQLQKAITSSCPNVLLENCASGGTRFDLGMLAYGVESWTSENTDVLERIDIMEGTGLLYPLGVCGTCVSPVPDRTTLRRTGLEARFSVAAFGCLNYSLDLTRLSGSEKKQIRDQIDFYKQYRQVFQFGRFKVQKSGNETIWTVSSPKKDIIIAMVFQKLQKTNSPSLPLRIQDVKDNCLYQLMKRDDAEEETWDLDQSHHQKEDEVHRIPGDLLKYAGIQLADRFTGPNYVSGMRVLPDFSSRIYIIKEISE